jgi:Na+-transporting NADH:ubiquinone oxidoreductase subunit NqrD
MEHKKNKKLTVQVDLIILPIFIAMITAIAFAMYYSALNGFLDAQKSHMEYLINNELAIQHYIDQASLNGI